MAENNQHSLNLMEKLRYDASRCIVTNLIPTLKYMSFNRIFILLWNNLRSELRGRGFNSYYVRNIFITKILSLKFPKALQKGFEEFMEIKMEEINKIFRLHFLDCFISYELFVVNVCWTQQGTINISKTVSQILKTPYYSKFKKFVVACDFFLEDKIRDFLKNEPIYYQNNFEYHFYSVRISRNQIDLVNFWLSYITHNEPSSFLNCQLLLDFAVKHNSIAVPYIWENFADESFKYQIIQFINSAPFHKDDHNILFYFYTQMNQAQLREVKITFYHGIINKICSIARWSADVSVSLFLLDLIKIRNAIDSIYIIIYSWCMHRDFIYFREYEVIWYKFGVQFRLDIKKNINELVDKTIENEFPPKMVMITLSLLLKTTTDEDKQKVIYNSKLMKFCNKMITVDIHALEEFIKIFKGEINIKFKENFLRNEGVDICLVPVNDQNFEIADKILAYFWVTDDISEFKKRLPYENNAKILNHLVLYSFDVEMLNNFLMWCFEGNEEETENCKAVLFDFNFPLSDLKKNVIKKLENLFEEAKIELFKDFWNFIFNTKENIDTPNKKMRRIKKIISFSENFNFTSNIDNRLFKRFGTTCLNPEADSLEEQERSEDLFVVVRSFCKKFKLTELIKALDWFYSSDERKIDEFKEAAIRFCLSSILIDMIKWNSNEFSIQEYFCTFITSVKFANMFKEIFTQFKQKKEIAMKNGTISDRIYWTKMKEDIAEILKELERYTQKLLIKEKYAENEISSLANRNRSASNSHNK